MEILSREFLEKRSVSKTVCSTEFILWQQYVVKCELPTAGPTAKVNCTPHQLFDTFQTFEEYQEIKFISKEWARKFLNHFKTINLKYI